MVQIGEKGCLYKVCALVVFELGERRSDEKLVDCLGEAPGLLLRERDRVVGVLVRAVVLLVRRRRREEEVAAEDLCDKDNATGRQLRQRVK